MVIVTVDPFCYRKINPCHNRSKAHRLAPACNQSVGKPKRTVTGHKGGMTLRPVGSYAEPL